MQTALPESAKMDPVSSSGVRSRRHCSSWCTRPFRRPEFRQECMPAADGRRRSLGCTRLLSVLNCRVTCPSPPELNRMARTGMRARQTVREAPFVEVHKTNLPELSKGAGGPACTAGAQREDKKQGGQGTDRCDNGDRKRCRS